MEKVSDPDQKLGQKREEHPSETRLVTVVGNGVVIPLVGTSLMSRIEEMRTIADSFR